VTGRRAKRLLIPLGVSLDVLYLVNNVLIHHVALWTAGSSLSNEMSTTLQPKAVYEPAIQLEAFYTGGAVRVTRDHKHIACACGDEVKVQAALVLLLLCDTGSWQFRACSLYP